MGGGLSQMPHPKAGGLALIRHVNGHQILSQTCWIQPFGETHVPHAGTHLRNAVTFPKMFFTGEQTV